MSTTLRPADVPVLDEDAIRPRAIARWGRYAAWQLRDYIRGAGGGTLAAAVLVLAIASGSTPLMRPAAGFILGGIGFLGSLFAINGLVSSDRARGWYRFALAKPVMPWRYYAQAFAVRGVGLLGITAIAWALLGLFGASTPPGGALLSTALYFALFGSVTLALSVVVRHEWLATSALYAASAIATSLAGVDRPGWRVLGRVLHWVLPPFGSLHTVGAIALGLSSRLASSEILGSVLWIAGYSAAAFAAAMLLLRRREWAK